tara:strand:+ start:451 stop:570 length:120 start_codon:yes stop_codon:yes gene_type:complete
MDIQKEIILGLIGDIRDNAGDKAMVEAIANVLIGELSAE